jgi:acyl-coenzyme A thioesterase PaaI-like protein
VYKLQPNSRHCFVCGLANPIGLQLRFFDTGMGEVTAEYTVPDHFQGYPGIVHGGIVAAMLDEVTARAQMSGDPPRFMYTARLEIKYRKNVPVGQPLRLVGQACNSRGKTATSKGKIYGPDRELLAEAQALLIDVPQDVVSGVDLEALGWRVYEDGKITSESE